VRLPGRFDRSTDRSFKSMNETVSAICDGLNKMKWLPSSANALKGDNNDDIPVIFMGFSYGTYIAYECVKYLQFKMPMSYSCFHLISIAGIAIEQLKSFPSLEDCTGETMAEKLRFQFLATHGKEPPKFGHKGFSSILEPMVEGKFLSVLLAHFFDCFFSSQCRYCNMQKMDGNHGR
jgi:surfactin synthase thioesterase subunit